MSLKKIRLELARDEDFRTGSKDHGYEFVVPLNSEGRFDAHQWQVYGDKCYVLRFWGLAEHEHGHLVRISGNAWAFHYENSGDTNVEDEGGYRFADHIFRRGEYVSIRETGARLRTFRVAQVSDVAT